MGVYDRLDQSICGFLVRLHRAVGVGQDTDADPAVLCESVGNTRPGETCWYRDPCLNLAAGR